jgi:hypothetical protein
MQETQITQTGPRVSRESSFSGSPRLNPLRSKEQILAVFPARKRSFCILQIWYDSAWRYEMLYVYYKAKGPRPEEHEWVDDPADATDDPSEVAAEVTMNAHPGSKLEPVKRLVGNGVWETVGWRVVKAKEQGG